jgi:hypothetical protein
MQGVALEGSSSNVDDDTSLARILLAPESLARLPSKKFEETASRRDHQS